MSTVYLESGQDRLYGWEEVSIHYSMDAIAATYDLTFSEEAKDHETLEDISLKLGDPIKIRLDNDLVLTGWQEEILVDYGADRHDISANGRSLTGDLVECPLDVNGQQNKQYKKQKFDAIAKELCAPFGVEVVVDEGVDLGDPLTQTIDEGQTIHEFLNQLARYRGLRLTSDFDGRLHITKPGIYRTETVLKLGENIKRGSGRFSTRQVFSSYTILSQLSGFGAEAGPDVVARQKGRELEEVLKGRHRPFVAVSDRSSSSGECQSRAKFEQRTRNGRAQAVTYVYQGWKDEQGLLWRINTVVPVYDSWMGIQGDRLISGVRYIDSDDGLIVEITVMPLSSFDMRIESEKQEEKFF